MQGDDLVSDDVIPRSQVLGQDGGGGEVVLDQRVGDPCYGGGGEDGRLGEFCPAEGGGGKGCAVACEIYRLASAALYFSSWLVDVPLQGAM